MGASTSRDEDAALMLAVPKHKVIGGRRILDAENHGCSRCSKKFTVFRKKHYCRRCGDIICEECCVFRHYKTRNGYAFRVCNRCNRAAPIIHVIPQKVWHKVLAFAGNVPHHRTIQVCRKLQLSVPLPYPWGPGWDAFFTEGIFLSKGANGSVYRTALKTDPKVPVAVKVVQKNTIFSLRKWHHIQREIDTLLACKHKHVIDMISVTQSPESVFIVLQYAQGGDLFDWLMTRKAPSEAEVRNIAAQLLSTLHHIHDVCGAVHRDIKPENILLEKKVKGAETPLIRLADFGFARLFPTAQHGNSVRPGINGVAGSAQTKSVALRLTEKEKQALKDITVAATPCGTLGFAAPEIIEAYSSRRELHRQMDEMEEKQKASPPRKTNPMPKSKSTDSNDAPETPDALLAKEAAQGPITPVEHMKKMDIFAAGVTFCILLTGCEPFPCHSSKAHLDAVNAGLKFSGRQWSHVSNDARDLLRRMLHPQARKRPTAFEALQSPWLKTICNANFLAGHGSTATAKTTSSPSNRSGGKVSKIPMPAPPSSSGSQAIAKKPAVGPAGADPDLAASFQQSLRSLRKNDGMIFITDKSGNVQRKKRADIMDDTLDDTPAVVEEGTPVVYTPQAAPQPTPAAANNGGHIDMQLPPALSGGGSSLPLDVMNDRTMSSTSSGHDGGGGGHVEVGGYAANGADDAAIE